MQPDWVGPTIAVSLVVIALACIIAALFAVGTLLSVKYLADELRSLSVGARHEVEQVARLSRGIRRRVRRGVLRVEDRLADLEALYDVVHGEVQETALDVASALRAARTGGGVLAQLRRLLVPRRRRRG